ARRGGRARPARAAYAGRPARAAGPARRRPGRRPRQPRLPPPLRRGDRLPRPPLGRAPLARLQRRRLGDHGGRRRDLATRAEEPRLLASVPNSKSVTKFGSASTTLRALVLLGIAPSFPRR